jgi:hypothetical protein
MARPGPKGRRSVGAPLGPADLPAKQDTDATVRAAAK